MENRCRVLRIFNTSMGQIVFLECANDFIPKLGTVLRNSTTTLEWKIIGMSMPITVELLPEKIETYYGSEEIWNCLVSSISHSRKLEVGDTVTAVGV